MLAVKVHIVHSIAAAPIQHELLVYHAALNSNIPPV